MPDKTLFQCQQTRRWGKPTRRYIYDVKRGRVVPYHPPRAPQATAVWATTRYHRILRREVTSVRDTERQARRMGLEPIGDADLRTVARQHWPHHPLTVGMDGGMH